MTALEINTGDTARVLMRAALVLLMTPALAFFHGGMVRAEGVLTTMMSIVTMGIVGVAWVLSGFSEAFGDSPGTAWSATPPSWAARRSGRSP